MALANTGAALQHLTPRPVKGLFGDNYLSVADMDFTQQFLPEVYEKEVERYGKRTVGGFLRMVGAEMPMASDRIVWSEQGRLPLHMTALIQMLLVLQLQLTSYRLALLTRVL